DECTIHGNAKEQAGWYPRDRGRSGYDTTSIPRKTIAVASKKLIRKTLEQLDNGTNNEKIEASPGPSTPITNPTNFQPLNQLVESDDEEEVRQDNERLIHKLEVILDALHGAAVDDPHNTNLYTNIGILTLRRAERIRARENLQHLRQLYYNKEEHEERDPDDIRIQETLTTTESGEDSPYDSDEPRDVARRRARDEITWKALPEDQDSETEEAPEGIIQITLDNDDQEVEFYGVESHRGQEERLHMWTTREFTSAETAIVKPNPCFPMRCLHNLNMDWQDCQNDQCQVHYIPKARMWRRKQLQDKKGTKFSPPTLRIRDTLKKGGVVKYPNNDGTYTERRQKQSKN
ncbi:hypothetical protein CPLU01_16118, partial [Colletotrichum plurivorum]